MALKRVSKNDPLEKSEFHHRLREWFQNTGENMVGPIDVDGRTRWIYIQDGSDLFGLHADTSREAVDWYLQVVSENGDDLRWDIAASQRGKMTAVVYGPNRLRKKSFYLYAVGSAA
jgi:hypothetical protein